MKRWALLAVAVMVAIVASQFPAYRQQYLQRLGGALDEVTRQVEALDARAEAAGLGRYPYLRRLMDNPDPIVVREGEALVALVGRKTRLEQAIAAVETAPVYLQAVQVLFRLERDVAAATLRTFEPALPLSVSGGFHAFIGFFLGWLLPQGVRRLFPRREVVDG